MILSLALKTHSAIELQLSCEIKYLIILCLQRNCAITYLL